MVNEEIDGHSQMFAPFFPPFQNNDIENESRHSCILAVEKLFL